MISYNTTAPQLTWKVAVQGDLTPTAAGVCRICGGNLVGKYQSHINNSNAWMDEFRTVARYSDYICEACDWCKRNRSLFMKLRMAMIISPELGWLQYSSEQVDEFLHTAQGLKSPYVMILNRSFNVYKKHLIFDAAVSWGEPAYLTLLTGQDNFTIPLKISRLSYALAYLEKKYGGKKLEGKVAHYLMRRNDFLWELAFSLYVRKFYPRKGSEKGAENGRTVKTDKN